VLPRIGGELLDAGFDASVDAGLDARVDPDAGPDASPGDGGPEEASTRDSGTEDARILDSAACGPPEWLDAAAIADTALIDPGVGCTACGGASNHGADARIDLGVGVGLFKFAMPMGLTPMDFTSGVVRTVVLTLTRVEACGATCPGVFELEARPARNDWVEGTAVLWSGANWCRLSEQPEPTMCPSTWDGPGASGSLDVWAGSPSFIAVPPLDLTARLVIPPSRFAGFASATELTIRVAPLEPGPSTFIAHSREVGPALAPALAIEVCR
jgi:hypothetical protein